MFPTFTPLTISSFYTALDNNQVDAAVVFTTDPPLKTGKYTVLKDTKFIFGFQNVGMVVKKSVATAEGIGVHLDDQRGQHACSRRRRSSR